MMKEYETLVLLVPTLTHEQIDVFHEKLEKLLSANKSHLLSYFNWGKRKLAYRVEKHWQGIYLYFRYLNSGAFITEFERLLKIDDLVLKFITVKLADGVDVEKRKSEEISPTPFSTYDEVLESFSSSSFAPSPAISATETATEA